MYISIIVSSVSLSFALDKITLTGDILGKTRSCFYACQPVTGDYKLPAVPWYFNSMKKFLGLSLTNKWLGVCRDVVIDGSVKCTKLTIRF